MHTHAFCKDCKVRPLIDLEQTSYSLDKGWSSKFPALFPSTGNILWRTPEGSLERTTNRDNDDMKEGEKGIQP